jgi:hypothetical protein
MLIPTAMVFPNQPLVSIAANSNDPTPQSDPFPICTQCQPNNPN